MHSRLIFSLKDILYITENINKQNFRKMATKHYIVLYSIKNKTVIIKKVLTQGMNI